MPELPEVESARSVIERAALGRTISDVDDSDTYECRPHAPGEIRAALVGRRLTAAHRRGKSMWCDTSGVGRSPDAGPGARHPPRHVRARSSSPTADGTEIDGGDYWERGRAPGDYRYSRFALSFADGGSLLLVDPRRLGRVRLDPDVDALGPDAARDHPRPSSGRRWPAARRRSRRGCSTRTAVAGIGNLLADQALWSAKINPAARSAS